MEKAFTRYARFYNSLYRDKDYNAECSYLSRLFKKHSKVKIKNILDLGCGTGGHALVFAGRNYKVTGLDRSLSMLDIARAGAKESGATVDFYKRDIRRFDLKKRCDAIISMFAVMGYQTKTEDFLRTLKCARKHLRPGGVFVFDVWFGPAVLAHKPGSRTRCINEGEERIIRRSLSELDIRRNLVKVNFDVRRIRGNDILEQSKEVHLMRFFFIPEIDYLAKASGFKQVITYAFLTERKDITEKDWNLCVVLK